MTFEGQIFLRFGVVCDIILSIRYLPKYLWFNGELL